MRPRSPSALLKAAKVSALLVTEADHITYLTRFPLTQGLLLALPRRYFLFVDPRYIEAARDAELANVTVRSTDDFQKAMDAVRRCGFEADRVTVARFTRWKKQFPRTTFVPTNGAVAAFRRQKDDEELRYIRTAERMTREILRRVPAALKPGITEERLARQLLFWALELGADGLAFEPTVAFGTHTSVPHHRPGSRTLKKGHIVQIDVGAQYRGYKSDASEVYFTSKPTDQHRKTYDALVESQRRASKLLRSGATNREVDDGASAVLRDAGIADKFLYTHFHALGHGVGRDIHEGVTLSQRAPKTTLLSREVVAIEPGVYVPGKWGMRLEKIVVIQ